MNRTMTFFATAVAIAAGSTATAQNYPAKPIRIISEYSAGNGGDVFFRHLARFFSAATEQQWVIDNRSGAGGLLAVEAAMRVAPDGYTLLAASQNVFVTRRYLSRTGHVDALQDFTPVSALWRTTLVIAASETLPGFEPPPTWTALFAPARLPPAILASLHASIVKGVNAPEARAKAASDGFELIGNTPEQFAAQIKRDIEVAGRLVKVAKIEPLD